MLDEIVYNFNKDNNTLNMQSIEMPDGIVAKYVNWKIADRKHRVFVFEDGSALEVGVGGEIFKAGKEYDSAKIDYPIFI
jgi:hypothetical protein